MKRRTFLSLGIASLLLVACGKSKKLPAIPAGKTVLAFGDSVTYGTGADRGEDWPSLLAGLTGWQVVNAGVSGDTAAAGTARIQALLDEHKPKLVISKSGETIFCAAVPPMQSNAT